jgi:hypothetical protein
MTEANGRGFASVLSADTDLQVRARLTAPLRSELHELANAFLIEHLEGVRLQDSMVDIERQEPS